MIEDNAGLRALLQHTRTIAVVGLSANPHRPSNEVACYLRDAGYTIIPVNPACDEILGEKCYPSLREVPMKIDIVDVFRNPADVPAIVEDAIAVGAGCVWLQLGVIAPEAAARAEAAGLKVVMDRCTKIDHRHLIRD
jgi:predicted CoA-binding protein